MRVETVDKEMDDMVFAADYPLLNIFWTMGLLFCWVIWFWLIVGFLGDVFSRKDISGWAKAAWAVFMIVLPFLGVLTYVITHGKGIAERRARESQAARSAASGGPAAEIGRAEELLDRGAITEAEFGTIKAKVLA